MVKSAAMKISLTFPLNNAILTKYVPLNEVLSVRLPGPPKLASKENRRCHMYAIIATGGKQYKVSEGDTIKVEKLGVEAGETVTFDQILVVNNGELAVGCPTVAGATVTGTVVKEGKAKKVIVYKYKRKSGYHKKNGHRQAYTQIKIDKINA
jgi:large subunit ribosomal protein L21